MWRDATAKRRLRRVCGGLIRREWCARRPLTITIDQYDGGVGRERGREEDGGGGGRKGGGRGSERRKWEGAEGA